MSTKILIEIDSADATHLSEAYAYAQFYPETDGYIQLAPRTIASLRRVLDAIEKVSPVPLDEHGRPIASY